MENNYGLKRFNLMYNDYVIIGPKEDLDKCQNIQKGITPFFEPELEKLLKIGLGKFGK